LRIFSAEEGRSAPEFSAALRDSRRVDMGKEKAETRKVES
jgi:hypothetical protein